jgi:hypothetical protein
MSREATMTLEKKAVSSLIRNQVTEMQRYKWIESEKAGKDLGDKVLFEWIERYEDRFLRYHSGQ